VRVNVKFLEKQIHLYSISMADITVVVSAQYEKK